MLLCLGQCYADFAYHEITKAIGCLLAMSSVNVANQHELFQEEGLLFPCANFGKRFGLGRNRFNCIMRFLKISSVPNDSEDKWTDVREHVDDFNRAREQGFYPGWRMVIDESVSSWRGLDLQKSVNGMPHASKFVFIVSLLTFIFLGCKKQEKTKRSRSRTKRFCMHNKWSHAKSRFSRGERSRFKKEKS